jgi:hypothetical protein
MDRKADEMKILYFYRALVEAATGFIAARWHSFPTSDVPINF